MCENLEQAWSTLEEYEKIYDLYNIKVKNMPVWIFCREKFLEYLMGNNAEKDVRVKGSKVKAAIRLMWRCCDGTYKLMKLKKQDVILISNSRFRRGDNVSNTSHIYFEKLMDELKDTSSCTYLEMPTLSNYDELYRYSRYSKDTIPVDIGLVYARIFKILRRKEIKKIYREIEQLFIKRYHDDEICDFIIHLLKGQASQWILDSYFFVWLYKKINPNVIVDVANASRYALLIDSNTPIVEIQHGIIHKYHPAYVHTELGSIEMQRYIHRKHIMLYNDYYKDIIKEYSCYEDNLYNNFLVVGNPRFYDFKFRDKQDVYLDLGIDLSKKIILLTSQPIEEACMSIRNFIDILIENINLDEYEIVLKLHPREDLSNNIYMSLDNKITIIGENVNLLDLLNNTHTHISYTSTVLEEASFFKINNFTLSIESLDKYEYLAKQGKIKYIDDIIYFKNIIEKEENTERTLKANNDNSFVLISKYIQDLLYRSKI